MAKRVTEDGTFWLRALAVIGFPMLIFLFAVLQAFIVATLWRWYVVPAFDVSPLRLPFAYGLGLLVSYTRGAHLESNKDRKWYETADQGVAGAALVLLCGWIGTFFI